MDNTGHDIIHLFNEVLFEKDDLISIIKENDIINISPKVPGLIIQAYLVLVEIFNLDVMEPLKRVKEEASLLDTENVFNEVPGANNDHNSIENVFDQDSGWVKVNKKNFSKVLFQRRLPVFSYFLSRNRFLQTDFTIGSSVDYEKRLKL